MTIYFPAEFKICFYVVFMFFFVFFLLNLRYVCFAVVLYIFLELAYPNRQTNGEPNKLRCIMLKEEMRMRIVSTFFFAF